jgi:hypothetical protein
MRKSIVAAVLVLMALPARAEPPDDIIDLLGARAPGAESRMLARGYVDVGGNNIWWNGKTSVCVKVHVSQGRYAGIDEVADGDCGKFDEQSAGGSEPSKAAMDACMNSADEYQSEEPGTSAVRGARRSGANWRLTMNTLGRTTHCTVTQSGEIIGMDPP